MLGRHVLDSETKVTQSSIFVLIEENVERFDVPVYDSVVLQIVDCLENLAKDLPFCRNLLVLGVILEEVE